VDPPEPCELVRVVTGPPDGARLPAVEPDPECDVRVVTGAAEGAELAVEPELDVEPELECDARVVTGPAEGAELPVTPELECDALVRVVTAAPPAAAVAADPAACVPLDPVRTERVEGERPRLPAAGGPPDGPIPW
jgi:hypothetical protein